MKLIATVAVALAALALAAPNPEGQTTSIKLSKDYVDAIVAAYPDSFEGQGRSFSKRRLRKPALTRFPRTISKSSQASIRFKLLVEMIDCDVSRNGRSPTRIRAQGIVPLYRPTHPAPPRRRPIGVRQHTPRLRREDPRRETAPGKRGDLRLPQMNAEENGQETMLRPPLSPSSPVQLPALAGSPFPSCRWCFHLILRCCNHDEIAAEECGSRIDDVRRGIIGLCQSEQIPPNLHEGVKGKKHDTINKCLLRASLQSRLSTTMATKPDANAGDPISTENQVLNAGASVVQDFAPLSNVCAHLNAFHAYASDPTRVVEANHYCGHLNEDVRQCILYDSPAKNARIIGIEYMITPKLYETLDSEERKLWHSHVYEVKSGMLIMPQGKLPDLAWQAAENKEMEQVVQLYGKVFHLWQVDKGHQLPLGEPQLMTSFTQTGQLDFAKYVGDRDKRFNSDYKQKEEARKHIASPSVHPDADQAWKEKDKNKGVS
ncbi:hypothetical protein CABS01_10053 [Colletotrichum abscissum]|uniref:DUF1264-domain-containing protein n=1 Tax=Colletotrichum abscissum TaxID=1671311 RepID=A0A9Q0B9I4_9PEZI|nr:uncharacterized protein CABS01_10053 [Colletotrichum abscissum]KAI3558438.1 hypothetical protein CABS02_01585 [Colletotrichum abscissum]KAK1500329.1 hypothetical protein CABS01_10053 [Colletotrichum abscissum]